MITPVYYRALPRLLKPSLAVGLAVVLAGCLGAAKVEHKAEKPLELEAELQSEMWYHNGTFEPLINPCAGPCVGPTNLELLEVPLKDGTLRSVNLTVTWNPTSPLSEEFRVALSHMRGIRNQDSWGENIGRKNGPSPIEIRLEELEIQLNQTSWLEIFYGPLEKTLIEPLAVEGNLEQPYQIQAQAQIMVSKQHSS